ncbi:DMT family transporter [Microvirga aerilata]|uniref:DMT family transporter n=1 Tax=Microvirga aerilata TaxID=670292 RepID=A0A936Z9D4_9HYPH|nr:DMT family transporter [Microvirga aerilata]MBL0405277.1 DMT family transporter [Microvirga aerilata]
MGDPVMFDRAALRLTLGLVLIGTVGAAVVASGLDPITIVFWRSAIATLFLLVWCFATGILPDRTLTLRNLALGAVAGTSLVMSWAAFFGGIMLTSISTATILFHIQPFLILLISAAIWKERVSLNQTIWLAGAFAGVVLASGLSLSSGEVDPDWLLGIGITLGGAFFYAITAIAGKGLAGQRGEITTLCQTVVGIIVFAPFVDFSQDITLPSWGWVAMVGVLQTGVAWVLIYSAYPYVSTPVLAVLSFVNPLTAIMTDWLFFDHLLGWPQALGMVLIVIGTLGIKLDWRLVPAPRVSPPATPSANR